LTDPATNPGPAPAGSAGLDHLLVGFDGSAGGQDALELGRVLASPGKASVLVVAVFPYGPLPVGFEALQEAAREDAEPLFVEARERLEGLSVETRAFGGGSPAWVMNDLCESEDIDLIVVGSPHRGAVGRVVLGSVAENLLHGAPCAVAVAPRGYAGAGHEAGLRVIAVAYDGSDPSKVALHRAQELALATGATLRILTVVGPLESVPGFGGYVPVNPPQPDKVLEGALKAVGPEVQAEGKRLDGPPAATLAAACEDDVDLLVAGSRSYGPALRALLGSVSTQLIHEAPCPVLVAPRP
jgi:nucleotide-binding universal stress UspA family protein